MDYLVVHPAAVDTVMGVTRIYDLGPVRDPAFIEREPNPVVQIRMEDGRLIWRQGGPFIIWR